MSDIHEDQRPDALPESIAKPPEGVLHPQRNTTSGEIHISLMQHERWKAGGEQFLQFCSMVPEQQMHYETGAIQMHMLRIAALFLGEKPAVTMDRHPYVMEQITPEMEEALQSFGFESEDGYCYDPKLVQDVIHRHPDVFKDIPTNDFTAVFRAAEHNEMILGLLLGFPIDDVQEFATEVESMQFSPSRKASGAYGYIWMEYGSSDASKEKTYRLHVAFEASGIFDHVKLNPIFEEERQNFLSALQ